MAIDIKWDRDRASLALRSAMFRLQRLSRGRIHAGTRRMWAARRGFYIRIWRAAAAATDLRFTLLSLEGRMRIDGGDRSLHVFVNEVFVDEKAAFRRAGDKLAVHKCLSDAGLPVPRHVPFSVADLAPALAFLADTGGPLVVKPASDTGGGSGVSTNVMTAEQLRSAAAYAATFGGGLIAEEQVAGDCYRVLIMDGKVIDVIRRFPPAVTGDGKLSVKELVRAENSLRCAQGALRSQVEIGIDPDMINTLASQGLALASVPAKGQSVRLKQAISENALFENEQANGKLARSILEMAKDAARLTGTRLTGVDVICRDPARPLSVTGGVILEVNAPPGLYYHYIDERSPDVAAMILERYFPGSGDQT